MIRVCLIGLGKTGREIARALMSDENIKVVAAVCSPSSSKRGMDLGEVIGTGSTGVIIDGADNLQHMVFKAHPDVVIDFSNPDATVRNAAILSKMRVNMVIGTTGFTRFSLKRLFVLTRKYHNGIVYAPNITLGVNVLMLLTNLASSILNNYDFQITEIHHKNKKDAPSGTALKIAQEIERGLNLSGLEKNRRNVPIHAVRVGGVVGKHEVMIVGEDDKIEISHESFSRKAFAAGALRAVKFINGKSGYFEMADVLNLSKILNDYMEREDKRSNRKLLQKRRSSQ